MKTTFKVEGLRELEAALMQFEKSATRKTVVRNALRKAGNVVAHTMSQLAPVRSGRLSDSILVTTKLKNEAGAVAYAKALRATYGDKAAATKAMRDARRSAKAAKPPLVLFVGPSSDVRYATFIEFGTSPFISGGKFAGADNPGIRADPFVRPAWDMTQNQMMDVITAEMRVQIDKAIARQAKRGR